MKRDNGLAVVAIVALAAFLFLAVLVAGGARRILAAVEALPAVTVPAEVYATNQTWKTGMPPELEPVIAYTCDGVRVASSVVVAYFGELYLYEGEGPLGPRAGMDVADVLWRPLP